MLLTKYVANKFRMLDHLERLAAGRKFEKRIKKDVEVEKLALQQFLILASTIIKSKDRNLPEDIGPEIFDIYDVEIVVKPKSEINVEGVSLDMTSMKT